MGAPLRGIDIKLGKSPGGNAAGRAITDSAGNFTFGVVPAGSYTITLSISEPIDVAVRGAATGAINRSFNQAADASARVSSAATIDLQSDGKTPLSGSVNRGSGRGLQAQISEIKS